MPARSFWGAKTEAGAFFADWPTLSLMLKVTFIVSLFSMM